MHMTDTTPRVLLSVRRFSEKYPDFPQGGLRYLIFHSRNRYAADGTIIRGNGVHTALVRCGRKVLIDEARFFEWLDAQNAHLAA